MLGYRKRSLKSFFLLAVIVSVLIAAAEWYALGRGDDREAAFSKDRWVHADPSGKRKIATLLVNSQLLNGRPRKQIVELLGSADSQNNNVLSYSLGLIDRRMDELVIVFDKDDKAAQVAYESPD